MVRKLVLPVVVVAALAAGAGARELTSAYVVPSVANKAGAGGTDWHTDLTLYNPHSSRLPIVLQFLPAGRDNSSRVPTVTFDIAAWQTLNLWDVLGPHGFAARGYTGTLFVYADDERISCSGTACDFAAFSRTYTLSPSGKGELGQAIPGFPANLGLDRTVISYLPQVSDDSDFRTNAGVASWTAAWVKVREDIQDPDGRVIDRRDHLVPPFGQIQWRLERGVTGGSLAVYIIDGPSNALVFPYASVVNWVTGDPVYIEAHLTSVGLSAQAAATRPPRARPSRLAVPTFDLGRLTAREAPQAVK